MDVFELLGPKPNVLKASFPQSLEDGAGILPLGMTAIGVGPFFVVWDWRTFSSIPDLYPPDTNSTNMSPKIAKNPLEDKIMPC